MLNIFNENVVLSLNSRSTDTDGNVWLNMMLESDSCDWIICSGKRFCLIHSILSNGLVVGADVLDLAETMVASDGLKYEPVSMNTMDTAGVNNALRQCL